MSFKKNFSQAVDEISQKAAKVENPTSTGKENETAQADKEKAAIFTDQSVPVSVVAANDRSAGTTLTYITKDTTINGSVSTRGSLKIEGVIIGNVDCEKDICLNGKIEGDISAESIEMTESEIKGNVEITSSAVMKVKSVMKGDLKAKTAQINGTVAGNVVVEGALVILSEGRITGDIATTSFEVSKGAVINGKVTIEKSDNSNK